MTETDKQSPFAGNKMSDTQIVHFYRAEMNRMTVWRNRLDITTHWAIILSTGLTTFVLGGSEVPHYVMLLGLAFISLFMAIEGRRYQHLHHSKWRLGLLERNYFAAVFSKHASLGENWCEQLSRDLRRPHFTITWLMGIGLRLRRNYLVLIYFIYGVWLTKVYIHPTSPDSLSEYLHRLSLGQLFPWWWVTLTAAVFVIALTIAAIRTQSEESMEHWTALEHNRRFQQEADN